MEMINKYRILERRSNGDWTLFGVAYERDGRIVLFAPPWRADRVLAAASLEELDERHCPSAEFQWRAVESTSQLVTHPIELLQRALASSTAPEKPEPARPSLLEQFMAAFSGLQLQLATRSESATGEPEPASVPPLPEDAAQVVQEFSNDPELWAAYHHLKIALSDPQLRPLVLAALEGFAKAVEEK
jgi:hypothetical protein